MERKKNHDSEMDMLLPQSQSVNYGRGVGYESLQKKLKKSKLQLGEQMRKQVDLAEYTI